MSFLEIFYSRPDKHYSLDKMNSGYIHCFNNLVKPLVELNVIRQYRIQKHWISFIYFKAFQSTTIVEFN